MSQLIIAPSIDKPLFASVFLAGGITKCRDWQRDVIEELKNEDISIFSPRQKYFDIADKKASYSQIAWEFERLERMDIFSMYFCSGDSDQPICMYELGRNILRMQNRFPVDWKNRIVISVESGYKRKADVIIQTELCAPGIFIDADATTESHAMSIKRAIQKINSNMIYDDEVCEDDESERIYGDQRGW